MVVHCRNREENLVPCSQCLFPKAYVRMAVLPLSLSDAGLWWIFTLKFFWNQAVASRMPCTLSSLPLLRPHALCYPSPNLSVLPFLLWAQAKPKWSQLRTFHWLQRPVDQGLYAAVYISGKVYWAKEIARTTKCQVRLLVPNSLGLCSCCFSCKNRHLKLT